MLQYLLGVASVFAVLLLIRRFRPAAVVPPSAPEGGTGVGQDIAVETDPDLPRILDALPVGVIVFDREASEVLRNEAAHSFTDTVHGDLLLAGAVERLVRRALRGRVVTEVVQLVGPPQKVIQVSVSPFGDGGALAMLEDNTERSLVDQVRTDFVANVSHELKTPVGAISILAETLEGETEDDLVKRLAGRMVSESHRMARTIDDLLELSRIEMGGEVVMTAVDMGAVVDEAIDRASGLSSRRGVPVEKNVLKGDVTVRGDHFQLVSAIGNLVENAVKYSEENGTVTVSLIPLVDSVDVEVVDRGIGIPAASLDRIFERFYRVDRSHSRATGGTGLGLSIVRRVITNHGGEVNVSSREGEGSTFTVRLPRHQPARDAIMGAEYEPRVAHE
jgi:two-component system sensor histidine kinase SenX3